MERLETRGGGGGGGGAARRTRTVVGVGVAGAPGVDVVAGPHLRPLHPVRQQPHRRRRRSLPSGPAVRSGLGLPVRLLLPPLFGRRAAGRVRSLACRS
jgi:hypothetical protein